MGRMVEGSSQREQHAQEVRKNSQRTATFSVEIELDLRNVWRPGMKQRTILNKQVIRERRETNVNFKFRVVAICDV